MKSLENTGSYIATQSLGADPAPTLYDAVTSPTAKTAAALALTYHGYRRTGSIVWALVYGLAGRLVPVAAVPIAIGQGFGERKPCP